MTSRMSNYVSDQLEKMAKPMNRQEFAAWHGSSKGWNSVPYQTTHNTGGAIMGADPKTSAVNQYLQSWDVPMSS